MNPPGNVLLITVDHWPGALLGCLNHPVIQTPTLDSLAADGILYRNAYSPSPVCVPARRSLHTGLTPRSHGDRCFRPDLPLPPVPTLAQAFRDAGYQTSAVGKIHVTLPARNRIGFEEMLLNDESRSARGQLDDYELFLGDQGYPGAEVNHGTGNNEYLWRSWHLPEHLHVTNWTTREMVRQIVRRDPTRPAFWYCSYSAPHPPLVPPQSYLDLYREEEIDGVVTGDWGEELLRGCQTVAANSGAMPWQNRPEQVRKIRRAFYAACTQIDHQLRLVLGTLREQGVLDQTTILFTSDHGDMLGNHGLWRKRVMYEGSANIPMLLVPAMGSGPGGGVRDHRLAGIEDVMPTLLELAGVPVPDSVEGRSLVSGVERDFYFSEDSEGVAATRMIRDRRYKLIYYAEGNRRQLFDLETDRDECHDLAGDPAHCETLERLSATLLGQLYGNDAEWADGGRLRGYPEQPPRSIVHRRLRGQRGTHWPPAP